jgi:tetratricopeptide (TPR) repeat protein
VAEAENAYGLALWSEARYDSAVAHLQEARSVWEALHDSAGLGRVNNNLGVTHYQWGNLELALDSYLRALAIRRAMGDARGVALVLTNVGLTYKDLHQPDLATATLADAVAAADTVADPSVQGYARYSLGLARLEAGDPEGARRAFEESLAIYQDQDSAQAAGGRALNIRGLARVRLLEGDAQGAVAMLEDLFDGAPEGVRSARQALALLDLGRAYDASGASDRAVPTLERGLALGRSAGQRVLVVDALDALSRVHESRGELRQALEYTRRRDALRDSLAVETGAQQVAAVALRLASERQARENQTLRAEQQVREAVIARQRLGFALGGGVLALALALAGTLVYVNRQGHAQRTELDAINRSLAAANRELREAVAEVQTLEGLIPICARCKKVRDDQGFWESVESYISRRSEALFSHCICNECGPELYGEDWVSQERSGV